MLYRIKLSVSIILLLVLGQSAVPNYSCNTWNGDFEKQVALRIASGLFDSFSELEYYGFHPSPMLPDNVYVKKAVFQKLSIYVWKFAFTESEDIARSFLWSVFHIFPPKNASVLQTDVYERESRYNKNINGYVTTIRVITNAGAIYIEFSL